MRGTKDKKAVYLRRLAEGDPIAFAWVFRQYAQRVSAFARETRKDESAQEDFVQEVFLRLWSYRERLPDVLHFDQYFYILYKNMFISKLRKETHQVRAEQTYLYGQHDSFNDVEAQVWLKHLQEMISGGCRQLAPQQRQVFTLRFEEGWPPAQIATYMKLSEQTVRNHFVVAMKKMKKHVKPWQAGE